MELIFNVFYSFYYKFVPRELQHKRTSGKYRIGIDEVGRGALAGPVVVAAVAMLRGWRIVSRRSLGKLRDSKKLSPMQRERWFNYLVRHPALCYSIARLYPRRIEKLNIAKATNIAALSAYNRLVANGGRHIRKCGVVLDGSLFLGNGKPIANAKTVVRGDEKFTAVKIASILAKVSRDRLMTRLARKYPAYGFEVHKGYGTAAHVRALRRHGPSDAHRLTFVKNFITLKPSK